MPTLKFDVSDALAEGDVRSQPAYSAALAGRYLNIPVSTINAWFFGMPYGRRGQKKHFEPVLSPADSTSKLLSFENLGEALVFRTFRRNHNLALPMIREALEKVSEKLGIQRPLVHHVFFTDGARLFVEHAGKYIDAQRFDQLLLPDAQLVMNRIEWNQDNDEMRRLFPITRSSYADSPKIIVIDPEFAFGATTIVDRGIPTRPIRERWMAGESVHELSIDYRCEPRAIEEALRSEAKFSRAA
ncbi:DUF433 domain-containing protein [Candidatus Laterigemmans baculatus]|uniref:DUF433 domain-containing protein n=1 Tax=Candidatus Laterigemmans baculatus TaxID=2770505 RepID=UPI0013DC2F4C|nr:DUF433 domain-containing protein [Candidatus Laterigemmans baculatus]